MLIILPFYKRETDDKGLALSHSAGKLQKQDSTSRLLNLTLNSRIWTTALPCANFDPASPVSVKVSTALSVLESSGQFSALILFNLAAALTKIDILYLIYIVLSPLIFQDAHTPGFFVFLFPTSLVFLLSPFMVLPLLSNPT